MKSMTVMKLYKKAYEDEQTLLPDLDGITGFDWWHNTYTATNQADLDILFTRMFASYEFYSPLKAIWPEEYDEAAALTDFKQAVYTLFIKNDKKYTELYRIHTIPDNDAYALTNNYDLHETYSGTNATQGSAITGQRTDVSIDNTGEQESAGVNKVTGWNSNTENTNDSNTGVIGSRQDTHQFTKGQEQDTSRTAGQDAHTLRRFGNIGVMTVTDMLRKNSEFWQYFSFLQIIFDDICKEFLLIGDDYIWH